MSSRRLPGGLTGEGGQVPEIIPGCASRDRPRLRPFAGPAGLHGAGVQGPRTCLASPSWPRMLTGLGSAPAPLLRTGTCSSAFADGSEQRQTFHFFSWDGKKIEVPYPREHRGGGEDGQNSIHPTSLRSRARLPCACLAGLTAPASVEILRWFNTGKAQSFLRSKGYGRRCRPLFGLVERTMACSG